MAPAGSAAVSVDERENIRSLTKQHIIEMVASDRIWPDEARQLIAELKLADA